MLVVSFSSRLHCRADSSLAGASFVFQSSAVGSDDGKLRCHLRLEYCEAESRSCVVDVVAAAVVGVAAAAVVAAAVVAAADVADVADAADAADVVVAAVAAV